jgi:hypothetical protein
LLVEVHAAAGEEGAVARAFPRAAKAVGEVGEAAFEGAPKP